MIARAQPDLPGITFTLAQDEARPAPLTRVHRVEGRCRYRDNYNYEFGKAGTWRTYTLQGGPLFADTTTGWISYGMYDSWCATTCMLVIADDDTMRLEFVDSLKACTRLMQRAWKRWVRESPEVIRFRKGTYRFEEVIADPWAVETANAFAERLIAEEGAAYRKLLAEQEEYYRAHPTPPPVEKREPPPPMTPEEIEREIVARPGLKQVELDRVGVDTVWVRISGRVMLNGGCGNGMPLFGIEMRTDSGWVDRIPFEPIQMACGMPWADWEEQQVMMPPLRWWVSARQPEGHKELLSGTYRLFFVGADLKRMQTAAFELR